MDWAAFEGVPQVIDFLMSHQSNSFALSTNGQTPLHIVHSNVFFVLTKHGCGFEQRDVKSDKIKAADLWSTILLDLSEFMEPFSKFYECYNGSPVPCVNVIDSEGSANVECAFGHLLRPVVQLGVDPCECHLPYAGDKLSKILTCAICLTNLFPREMNGRT